MKNDGKHEVCPKFEKAFMLIGKRWTGLIIRLLMDSKARFSDLESAIPNLSGRMLAERLRELEQEDIVKRSVYGEVPVRIEYELTPKGSELAKSLNSIQEWAEKWN
jgi:DNA-binding HxlR family transcriptional regulator